MEDAPVATVYAHAIYMIIPADSPAPALNVLLNRGKILSFLYVIFAVHIAYNIPIINEAKILTLNTPKNLKNIINVGKILQEKKKPI